MSTPKEDLIALREDPPGTVPESPTGWVWHPKHSVNALSQVFCEPYECELRELMCHTHSSMHWCTTNSALFNGGKEAAKLFQRDRDVIQKNAPHMTCVDFLCNMVVKKWTGNSEEVAMKQWIKSWGKC